MAAATAYACMHTCARACMRMHRGRPQLTEIGVAQRTNLRDTRGSAEDVSGVASGLAHSTRKRYRPTTHHQPHQPV